jgi:hypothetical protein
MSNNEANEQKISELLSEIMVLFDKNQLSSVEAALLGERILYLSIEKMILETGASTEEVVLKILDAAGKPLGKSGSDLKKDAQDFKKVVQKRKNVVSVPGPDHVWTGNPGGLNENN